MVVFVDGKPLKRDYKRFKIHDLLDQDDYASMEQALTRRFRRYLDQDKGFSEAPDLLLIDGGVAHAQTAENVLQQMNLSVPVYGMVKDNRHRTRALVTADGREIGIQTYPAVFALIGQIREETHRFAIAYHRLLRSKRLCQSVLDEISGIGPVRKKALLDSFRSVDAIEKASLAELEEVLPKAQAMEVYRFFHQE